MSRIVKYEQDLSQLPEPEDIDIQQIDNGSIVSGWVTYMQEVLQNDFSPDAIATARKAAFQMDETIRDEDGDDIEPVSPEFVEDIIQRALFINKREHLSEMLYVRDKYTSLELAARMLRPEAEVNILRQGFILLLTAFDAAVFDLVRIALTQDFFRLISAFGKQEKVPIETIARCGSFDVLRASIIEEQLKARYLKDLLFLLHNLGVKCVNEANGERFAELIELVMRRNVHVHNRGIVDERYVERDQQGQPRYNIYNLSIGSIAEIDHQYLDRANKLCRHCVDNISNWVENRISTN